MACLDLVSTLELMILEVFSNLSNSVCHLSAPWCLPAALELWIGKVQFLPVLLPLQGSSQAQIMAEKRNNLQFYKTPFHDFVLFWVMFPIQKPVGAKAL